MEHFSSAEWVDFVRGLQRADHGESMNRHLSEGCSQCLAAHAAWSALAAFAAEEVMLPVVAENDLRVAKSFLAQHAFANSDPLGPKKIRWPRAALATLVFDSLNEALPAGLRASGTSGRHLLYTASPLAIDLHVDDGARRGRFLLAGQIADSTRPESPPDRVRLTLMSRNTELHTFEANEFGEFHCELDRREELTLLMQLEHDTIAIPLDDLFESSNPTRRQKVKDTI